MGSPPKSRKSTKNILSCCPKIQFLFAVLFVEAAKTPLFAHFDVFVVRALWLESNCTNVMQDCLASNAVSICGVVAIANCRCRMIPVFIMVAISVSSENKLHLMILNPSSRNADFKSANCRRTLQILQEGCRAANQECWRTFTRLSLHHPTSTYVSCLFFFFFLFARFCVFICFALFVA